MCSPNNIDLCDDAKKAEIKKFQDMAADELDKLIAKEEEKLEEAESLFKEEVQKLQDKYTALSTEKDEKIAAVKAAGLGKLAQAELTLRCSCSFRSATFNLSHTLSVTRFDEGCQGFSRVRWKGRIVGELASQRKVSRWLVS